MPTLISGSTGVNKITDGTIVDADVTDVAASKLTGTIADARFPSTLPAASAANLTAIPAANITGTLPAISGANLTNLPAASATVACYAYTDSQSLANAVSTKIQFSSEHFDVGTDFDSSTNYRFTAPSAGKYLVITSMSCADSQMTTDDHFQIELRKNGSMVLYQNWSTSTTMRVQNVASRILDLSANDYLEAFGYQSSGSTITIGFQSGTYICVYKLG